jgi:hypothetical protein
MQEHHHNVPYKAVTRRRAKPAESKCLYAPGVVPLPQRAIAFEIVPRTMVSRAEERALKRMSRQGNETGFGDVQYKRSGLGMTMHE